MSTRRTVTTQDYKVAFAQLLPTMDKTKERVLRAMMALPNQTASSHLLLRLLKLKDHVVINQAIGQLGGQVFRILGVHPEGWKRGDFQSWTVIAEMGEEIDSGFPWKLRSQVVAALKALNFEGELFNPEELSPAQTLWEGALTTRSVNVYERSLEARRLCIAKKGCRCAVCEIDFGETYGKALAGFIHVHHLIPIAKINARYEIDPEKDLVPVCPNCHSAIHYGGVTRSIAEVRNMLRR